MRRIVKVRLVVVAMRMIVLVIRRPVGVFVGFVIVIVRLAMGMAGFMFVFLSVLVPVMFMTVIRSVTVRMPFICMLVFVVVMIVTV